MQMNEEHEAKRKRAGEAIAQSLRTHNTAALARRATKLAADVLELLKENEKLEKERDGLLDEVGEYILMVPGDKLLASTTEREKKDIESLRQKLLNTCEKYDDE